MRTLTIRSCLRTVPSCIDKKTIFVGEQVHIHPLVLMQVFELHMIRQQRASLTHAWFSMSSLPKVVSRAVRSHDIRLRALSSKTSSALLSELWSRTSLIKEQPRISLRELETERLYVTSVNQNLPLNSISFVKDLQAFAREQKATVCEFQELI